MKNLMLTLLAALVFTGCAQSSEEQNVTVETGPMIDKAVAVMQPTAGSDVSGVVIFTKTPDGIEVEAKISGLEPGEHGFHIHQFGDLRKEDGTSAGGHFNPQGVPHAGPDSDKRHVGDLGNITADEDGNATYTRIDKVLSFSGESNILGRGVIIHQKQDDLTSQPTGAAGPRKAMGVVGVANPEL